VSSDEVTIERLERALALAAYLVSIDGEKAAPIFERLERELNTARAQQDTMARAQRMLRVLKDSHPQLLLPPTEP
jgi:hypothetical protein